MTLALVLILLGSLMVYGAWTNRSLPALIRGDNTVAKGAG